MTSRIKDQQKAYNKSFYNNDNITIDAKHSEMINYFKNLQNSIPSLKEELKNLILEYNNKDITRKNDIEYILYRDNLKDKINDLKAKINNINNNDEINKYFLDVGILLHNYYENVENSKNIQNSTENFEDNLLNYDETINDNFSVTNEEEEDVPEEPSKYKSVINFFNDRTEEPTNKNEGVYASLKISDFVKEESTFKKKNILDEYLQKIDPNYVSKIKIDYNICKCLTCNLEMTLYPSEGYQICESCGYQQNILIESDKPSFKDPPMEVCYFSYKRINHYNELYERQKVINESLKIIIC